MGDRGTIKLVYENGKAVYFYTHWKGSVIREILQIALRRRERWGDPSYLARIIFCELVKGQEDQETGFGIAPYETDREYPLLIVKLYDKEVTRGKQVWTFEQYIEEENFNNE